MTIPGPAISRPLPCLFPRPALRALPPGACVVALATVLLAVLTLRSPAAWAQDEPPIPAPGQKLPPHAAGGWPTSTTGDDEIPGRTPEQQARLDAVTGELKRLANQYGPDSVVLQSKLLVRSMSAGAAGATEVRVAGPAADDPGALEIVVDTGLFFDSATTTAKTRRDMIWETVAAPVLDEMTSFKIEPAALRLAFLFAVQDFSLGTAGQPDPTGTATREGFHADLSRSLLEDLIADRQTALEVASKIEFPGIDGGPSNKAD